MEIQLYVYMNSGLTSKKTSFCNLHIGIINKMNYPSQRQPFHSIEVKCINADDAIAGCRYLIIKIHFAPQFSDFALPHTFLS